MKLKPIHNLLESNRLVQSKQGETTGLMFDCCGERFSNVPLCSIFERSIVFDWQNLGAIFDQVRLPNGGLARPGRL